jgi:hypothetical protein
VTALTARIADYLKRHIVPGVLIGVMVAELVGLPGLAWGTLDDLWTASPRPTVIYTFRGSDPQYAATEVAEGNCWTVGMTSRRADSWRCLSEREKLVYDPCFSAESGAQDVVRVVCPVNPDDVRSVVALEFPRASVDWKSRAAAILDNGTPWYFTTSSGLICLRAGGTRADSPFGYLPFQCANPGTDLLHDIQSAKQIDWQFCTEPAETGGGWATRCLPYFTTAEVKAIAVSELWY